MASFLPAYDTRTGRKLPHFVPEHYFDHPVLGKNVRRTPRNAAATQAKKEPKKAAEQVESEA